MGPLLALEDDADEVDKVPSLVVDVVDLESKCAFSNYFLIFLPAFLLPQFLQLLSDIVSNKCAVHIPDLHAYLPHTTIHPHWLE